MKFIYLIIILINLITWYAVAYAEEKIVVIVSTDSAIENLTREEVINIFLGRYRQFPSGIIAQPIDQLDQINRGKFYKKLLGKELADINSYWARLIFSGKTKPPHQVDNINELFKIIETTPGAVGYAELKEINDKIKVVFNIN